MTARCDQGVGLERLIDYLLGELAGGEGAFEQHLFSCAACTGRLTGLVALGAGVRRLAAGGRVFAAVTGAHLERARADGLRLRSYRLAPGQTVRCTIGPEDDANVIHLAADLRDVDRVDLEVSVRVGELEQPQDRVEDLAVDRARGEVVLLYPGDTIRPLPHTVFRLALSGVGGGGQRRVLARYTLDHTPWPGA